MKKILFVDGMYFLSSSDDKKELENLKTHFEKQQPSAVFQIREYAVQILLVDSKTRAVKSWRQDPGYSLWSSVKPV
jgi:hypothetical protein